MMWEVWFHQSQKSKGSLEVFLQEPKQSRPLSLPRAWLPSGTRQAVRENPQPEPTPTHRSWARPQTHEIGGRLYNGGSTKQLDDSTTLDVSTISVFKTGQFDFRQAFRR